jgi:hypothetical protein
MPAPVTSAVFPFIDPAITHLLASCFNGVPF